jgi:uncharacterized FlaG/YvyC family protein
MSNENSNDNSNDNANENANKNTNKTSNENTNENTNENITFFLEEKDNNKKDNDEIQKMMDELNEHINASELTPWVINDDIEEDINPFFETLYQDYTIKDLLKIYNYYGIKTQMKSKLKKQQIIHTLIYFESLPENVEIVQKRYRMWSYITELLNDTKMKKYIIF